MILSEVLNLSNFLKTLKDAKINFQLAFKFYKAQQFFSDCENFYKENLNLIVEKYAVKENGEYKLTEDGNSILVQSGKEAECAQEMANLEQTKIDIDSIKIFEMADFENLNLTLEQGILLANLIKE